MSIIALAAAALPVAASAAESLPLPKSVVIDRSIPAAQREAMSLAARRYYAFWDTGDVRYANAVLAPDFVDRTLPAGRRAPRARCSRRRTSAHRARSARRG
jgi:predicted phosphoribosyltransferase